MVVRVLGSAAGGGVPQWNCGCRQCVLARAGKIAHRTQCSVGVSVEGSRWFLINASPDLRSQLLGLACQPRAGSRENVVESVLLTDADLDHTLGLFLLRESDTRIPVYASQDIREALEEGLRMTEVLGRYAGVNWVAAGKAFTALAYRDGSPSGLEHKAIPIAGSGPRYRRHGEGSCRLAYVIRETGANRGILIVPALAALEPALLEEMERADAVLLDGTLWAPDDFEKSGVARADIDELVKSHLPILTGSFQTVSMLPAKKKIYIHLNNTNPVLRPDGPERQRLDAANIQVGLDGMEFTV